MPGAGNGGKADLRDKRRPVNKAFNAGSKNNLKICRGAMYDARVNTSDLDPRSAKLRLWSVESAGMKNIARQFSGFVSSLILRFTLVLLLIVSLLFATQAQPAASLAEMKPGGVCAEKQCTRGCCANTACCEIVEQQGVPHPAAPAPSKTLFQSADIAPCLRLLFIAPPERQSHLIIRDEASSVHTLSPLKLICIRLI